MKTQFISKAAQLAGLFGGAIVLIASLRAQNLFVSDYSSGNIYEFTPGGTRSVFASGLNEPVGLAFDSAGNLFVATQGSGTSAIYKFTPAGVKSTFATGFSIQELAFMTVGSADEVYLCDVQGPGHVFRFASDGTRSTYASGSNLQYPTGLAFDSAGNLFVANLNDGQPTGGTVVKITPGGVQSIFATGFFDPSGLAIDAMDNVYVANSAGSSMITKITPEGVSSSFAGNVGNPYGLAFASDGTLFAASPSSNSIFEITPTGVESLFASGLNSPVALAFEPAGAVPEPATWGLLAGAAMAIWTVWRRGGGGARSLQGKV